MGLFNGPKEDAAELIDRAIEKAGEVIAGTVLPAAIDQIARADVGELVVEIRIRKVPRA